MTRPRELGLEGLGGRLGYRYRLGLVAVAVVGLGCSDPNGDDGSTTTDASVGTSGGPAPTGGAGPVSEAGATTAREGGVGGTGSEAGRASAAGGAGAAGQTADGDAGTAGAGAQAAGGAPSPQGGQGTTAGAVAGVDDGGPSGPSPGSHKCVPADGVDGDGPFTPRHMENAMGDSWVFYPEELGRDALTHPVFNWAPGAGGTPRTYLEDLHRLASHGFVVISQPSTGMGAEGKAALDWLLAQNERPESIFYKKLDTERVGAGGHSLGALATLNMAEDPRLKLYVLVCAGCRPLGGLCGGSGLHGPTLILRAGTGVGSPDLDSDYDGISAPLVVVVNHDSDHVQCASNNLAPWVAFMRWQFCDEDQWRPRFFDRGAYCTGTWECENRNF